MKLRLLMIVLLAIVIIGCKNQPKNSPEAVAVEYAVITPTELADNITKYNDVKVEVEGLVNHVCRTNKRMKMVTDNGSVITIYPKDTTERYDASLSRKIVKVYGIAKHDANEPEHMSGNASEHDEHEEEKDATHAPVSGIIITCDKYEIIGDIDAE